MARYRAHSGGQNLHWNALCIRTYLGYISRSRLAVNLNNFVLRTTNYPQVNFSLITTTIKCFYFVPWWFQGEYSLGVIFLNKKYIVVLTSTSLLLYSTLLMSIVTYITAEIHVLTIILQFYWNPSLIIYIWLFYIIQIQNLSKHYFLSLVLCHNRAVSLEIHT